MGTGKKTMGKVHHVSFIIGTTSNRTIIAQRGEREYSSFINDLFFSCILSYFATISTR